MAYSVMAWLVNPGEYPRQKAEEERAVAGRDEASGAATGANIGHALPRMVHGVHDSQNEAEGALEEVSDNLQRNAPPRISARSDRVWLLPASRVHYIVCEEVERSRDQG